MPQVRQQISQSQKLSQSVCTAIHLLTMGTEELTEEINRAAAENPALEVAPPRLSPSGGKGSPFSQEMPIAAKNSPLEDLKHQLKLAVSDPRLFSCALHLLYSLDSRGYLQQSLSSFAREEGISTLMAQKAMEAIQALEPAGIGARDLTECLLLQLKARPDTDPLCAEIVREYLERAAFGDDRTIARELGVTPERIENCMVVIRGLNPAPVDLDVSDISYVVPEFEVEWQPEGLPRITFFNDYFPTLRTDDDFLHLASSLSGEDKAFARKYILSARQLIRAVDLRQTTMEKLAKCIVKKQSAFFSGQGVLMPLTATEVAETLQVHPTTVYRAIRGKYLRCDQGTFPLSTFLQREISGYSTYDVQRRVKEMCTENPKLSDRLIGERLKEEGISVARRTIAKYRAQMALCSSYFREKR